MPARKKPPTALLEQAAELRAAGSSWEAVAGKVGRAADTVRRWPTAYPREWRRAVRAAERQLLAEATAESVLTLRRQLRSDDEKASRDAAAQLIRYRVSLGRRTRGKAKPPAAKGDTDGQRVAAYLDRLAPGDLDRLVADLRPLADGGRPAGQAAD